MINFQVGGTVGVIIFEGLVDVSRHFERGGHEHFFSPEKSLNEGGGGGDGRLFPTK